MEISERNESETNIGNEKWSLDGEKIYFWARTGPDFMQPM